MPAYGNKRVIRSCKSRNRQSTKKDKRLFAITTQKTKLKLKQLKLY